MLTSVLPLLSLGDPLLSTTSLPLAPPPFILRPERLFTQRTVGKTGTSQWDEEYNYIWYKARVLGHAGAEGPPAPHTADTHGSIYEGQACLQRSFPRVESWRDSCFLHIWGEQKVRGLDLVPLPFQEKRRVDLMLSRQGEERCKAVWSRPVSFIGYWGVVGADPKVFLWKDLFMRICKLIHLLNLCYLSIGRCVIFREKSFLPLKIP